VIEMARVLYTALALQCAALRLTPQQAENDTDVPEAARPLVNANTTMVAGIQTALIENLGNKAAAIEAVEKLFDGDGAPPLQSNEAKFLLQDVRFTLQGRGAKWTRKQAHFLGNALDQLERDTEPEPLETESSGSFLHELGTSLMEFAEASTHISVFTR
jgi:hypothetical protein